MQVKEKIITFFDALLSIFEGHNKPMYRLVMEYRHKIRNLIPEEQLLCEFKTFLSNSLVLSLIREYNLNVLIEVKKQFNSVIAQDIELLMDTCSQNNKKIIWKWINSIANSVLNE